MTIKQHGGVFGRNPTVNNLTVNGNITVTGTVDGRDVATDGTKLDGIEAGADVTDTTNVTAAGALMDSELTNITAVKALDQGVATTDSPSFAGLSVNSNPIATAGSLSNRNKIINGNFDVWQRGTSGTSGHVADRWVNAINGTTQTQTQKLFSLGQTDVPNEPRYYVECAVTSVAGAPNAAILWQTIEGVRTFAGQTVTVSFWAKADASKDIAVEFDQYFGTGGSPSSAVTSIGVTTCSLTTSWQKFTVTANIPSISGKTIGTAGNDFLRLNLWFDAGSDYNARTNSLGQQSGTFDIAQVQLEAGDTATPFEHRSYGQELALCQRYYATSRATARFTASAGSDIVENHAYWPVYMRANPTVTITAGTRLNASVVSVFSISPLGSRFYLKPTASGDCYAVNETLTLDAEL